MGRVEGIFTADVPGGECLSRPEVRAIAGVGLDGDRYAAGGGTFSTKRGGGRQLTLVSREALAALDPPLAPGASRRNVETSGVDLLGLVGRRFRIGDVECIGVRDCPPCGHLQKLTRPGVMKDLQGGGGLRADIVTTGDIAVGDEIVPLD